MRRALDETDRRRAKQLEYNAEHGITPQGIRKAVADIMEGAHAGAPGTPERYAKVAESAEKYQSKSPKELAREIDRLEKEMFDAAQNLEFERAAQLRDEVQQLRDRALGVADVAG